MPPYDDALTFGEENQQEPLGERRSSCSKSYVLVIAHTGELHQERDHHRAGVPTIRSIATGNYRLPDPLSTLSVPGREPSLTRALVRAITCTNASVPSAPLKGQR